MRGSKSATNTTQHVAAFLGLGIGTDKSQYIWNLQTYVRCFLGPNHCGLGRLKVQKWKYAIVALWCRRLGSGPTILTGKVVSRFCMSSLDNWRSLYMYIANTLHVLAAPEFRPTGERCPSSLSLLLPKKTRITRPGAQAYDRPGFNKFRLLGAPHFCCARNFWRPQFAADLEVCTLNVVFDHDSYLITQKMKVCGGLLQICCHSTRLTRHTWQEICGINWDYMVALIGFTIRSE